MATQVAWKLVYPVLVLSLGLIAIGIIAAWNVHSQQQESSIAIDKEMRSLIQVETANIDCREIVYRLNLFLRTEDKKDLAMVRESIPTIKQLLQNTLNGLSSVNEQDSMHRAIRGFDRFAEELETITASQSLGTGIDTEAKARLAKLADQWLFTEVIEPLEKCLEANQRYVASSNKAHSEAANNVMLGFLFLGGCGGLAGTLIGLSVGRAIGQSMVQLSVSIRDAAVRLSDAPGTITLTHHSDLPGLESGIRKLSDDIANVVQQLQQRERELSRSEQLARLGQLAAGMAHELRNPLTPMKMLVQSAIEKKEGGLQGRSLEIIYEEIMRQEKSIQSFLDFAKPPTPEKANCALQDVLTASSELIRGRCKQQHVEFQLEVPSEPLVATVDRNQISQLVLNLLLNALDAMPDGGKLDLKLSSWHQIDKSMHPHGERRDWIDISVTDTGTGIDAETMKNLFQPFATTKETGSGLGLVTCERIALDHGGRIHVESEPNVRTCFRFSFPKLDA